MFQEPIDLDDYLKAPLIATPINMMDSSPVCDGAAALVLVPTERAHEYVRGHHRGAVRILSSASANDTIAVHDRQDPLFLQAAYLSSQKVYQQAGIALDDIDFFELHDAFTIMSALSLEACGFARRGEGWRWAQDDLIGIRGQLPISTMGGLKSRGHPVGATGIYQIVEVVQQLTARPGPIRCPTLVLAWRKISAAAERRLSRIFWGLDRFLNCQKLSNRENREGGSN